MDLLTLFIALARQEEEFRQEAAQLSPIADVVGAELRRVAEAA